MFNYNSITMKFRNLLQLVFILIAGQLLFACNSAKYYEFSASKQVPYKVSKAKPAPQTVAEQPSTLTDVALAASQAEPAKKIEPALEANAAPVATARAKAPKSIAEVATEDVSAPENKITEAEALALAKAHVNSMSKAEKKELKKELKEILKQDRRGGGASIVEIILAILIPPLAVFLHEGVTSRFWISIILWILGVIPGIIFALLVVTDTI